RWNAEIFHRPEDTGPWRTPTRHGGFVTDFVYDWKKHRIPPKQVENADPLQFMILDAVDQALRDAGYDERPFDRHRSAAVLGTMFGGDFASQLNTALRLPAFRRTLHDVLRARDVPEKTVHAVGEEFIEKMLRASPAIHDETGSYTSSTLSSRIV